MRTDNIKKIGLRVMLLCAIISGSGTIPASGSDDLGFVEIEGKDKIREVYKNQACTVEFEFHPYEDGGTLGDMTIQFRNLEFGELQYLYGFRRHTSEAGVVRLEPDCDEGEGITPPGHPGFAYSMWIELDNVNVVYDTFRFQYGYFSCYTFPEPPIDMEIRLDREHRARINLGFGDRKSLLPFDREWVCCSATKDSPVYLCRLTEVKDPVPGQYALLQYCPGTVWHETEATAVAVLRSTGDRLDIRPTGYTLPGTLWDAASKDEIPTRLRAEETLVCDFTIPNIRGERQEMVVHDYFRSRFEVLSWVDNHYDRDTRTPVLEAVPADGPAFTFVAGLGDITGFGPYAMPSFDGTVPEERRMRPACIRDIRTGEAYYTDETLLGAAEIEASALSGGGETPEASVSGGTLTVKAPERVSVRISGIDGRLLHSAEMVRGETLDVSALTQGPVLIHLRSGTRERVIKTVV